jgi:hypothetical protein
MYLPDLDFAYDEPDVGYGKVRLHFNENLFLPEGVLQRGGPGGGVLGAPLLHRPQQQEAGC